MRLHIQPIAYGLDEGIKAVYDSLSIQYSAFLDDISVHDNLEPEDVHDKKTRINKILTGKNDLSVGGLFNILHKDDTPVIAITSLQVYSWLIASSISAGEKDNCCFVSAYGASHPGSDKYLNDLSSCAVHEVGHIFGLSNHSKKESALAGDKLCAMTIETKAMYPLDRVVVDAGSNLCERCIDHLNQTYTQL